MANEKRMIDANALIAYFEEQCNIAAKDTERESAYVLAALKCCIDLFQNFPTVDAVEVVHGRWESFHYGGYTCSNCGKRVALQGNYCHSCGAKMDGEAYDK
jgi:hypothetical protein